MVVTFLRHSYRIEQPFCAIYLLFVSKNGQLFASCWSLCENEMQGFMASACSISLSQQSCLQGKFTWKIENFTKLKDLLKKRKITSLCIKSRRFPVGGKDCRLIVYPRGQSQPPMHLSMFLEVTDSRNADVEWSCFVSHRLSVVNQHKDAEKSVSKESQNRYSKAAKDWGWREFVSLTSLFDTDLGFLVNDTIVLSAEVMLHCQSPQEFMFRYTSL